MWKQTILTLIFLVAWCQSQEDRVEKKGHHYMEDIGFSSSDSEQMWEISTMEGATEVILTL